MVKSLFRYLFLLSVSSVLAPTTVLSGGLPMRMVWRSFGRRAYWAGYSAIAAAMALTGGFVDAVIILAIAVLVGVYAEVEDHGSSAFSSGFVAILATVGTAGLAVGVWLFQTHSSLLKEVRSAIDPVTAQVMQINPSLHMTTDLILQWLPCGILIVLMMTLAVASMCEPALVARLKLRRANYLIRARLTQFQVPDAVVWLLMLSILGAFLKHGQPQLTQWSNNALWVFGALYFFQGLAVVVQTFRVFRVAPYLQVIWYAMILLQLFVFAGVFVGAIGLVDFWVDFRNRLAREPAESNKSFE